MRYYIERNGRGGLEAKPFANEQAMRDYAKRYGGNMLFFVENEHGLFLTKTVTGKNGQPIYHSDEVGFELPPRKPRLIQRRRLEYGNRKNGKR